MYRDWGACGETLERKLQRIIFGMLRVHSRSPQCQHADPVALSESVVLFSSLWIIFFQLRSHCRHCGTDRGKGHSTMRSCLRNRCLIKFKEDN